MKRILSFIINLPSTILNILNFKQHKVHMGEKSRICGPLYLRGRGKLFIGNNVIINSSRRSNPAGGFSRTTLWTYKGAELIIRDGAGISNCVIVCRKSVTIDENVKVGVGCLIYDNDFHSLDYLARRNPDQDIPNCKSVHIMRDAFISANSVILKGVTIGERAIIGAGSVVTRDVPSGEIWAGNPARYIKKTDQYQEVQRNDIISI